MFNNHKTNVSTKPKINKYENRDKHANIVGIMYSFSFEYVFYFIVYPKKQKKNAEKIFLLEQGEFFLELLCQGK